LADRGVPVTSIIKGGELSEKAPDKLLSSKMEL
jgi:hypothetical protein